MWRALYYLPLCVLWTAVVCSVATILGALSFRRFSHRLVDFFAPLWARGLLFFLGIRLNVLGQEHLAERKARVVVMNHLSTLDMLAMGAICPPGMMALGKKELAWFPFLGFAWWAMGQAFVDRKNKEKARASIAALRHSVGQHRRSLVVFPEGTRSRTGELQPFKMGAFHLVNQTRLPLVPMVIFDSYQHVHPDSIRVTPGEITVVILPERDTSDWHEDNLHEQRDALHAEYSSWVSSPPASLLEGPLHG